MQNVPRTIRESTLGKVTLRLVQTLTGYSGLVIQAGKIAARVDGKDEVEVWQRLQKEAGKGSPSYFGFEGARERFLRIFRGGFDTPAYVNHERTYKVEARSRLLAELPLEAALEASGAGEAALRVFNATNLVSPFEKMRVKDVLKSKDADAFIRAAATFTKEETKTSLAAMDRILRPHDAAKWTIITYLPFLWRPDLHMFLKPEVTKEFAERVGHRFARDYAPALDPEVYKGLLDLVTCTEAATATLKPADRIDVQSFIWVVGEYTVADEHEVTHDVGPV